MKNVVWGVIVAIGMSAGAARAENGHAAWLRYAPLPPAAAARAGAEVPRAVYRLGAEVPLARAEDELRKGVEGMLGRPLESVSTLPATGAIVIGTLASIRTSAPALAPQGDLPADAFWLRTVHRGDHTPDDVFHLRSSTRCSCQLPASSFQLPASSSQLPAPGSRLTAHGSRLNGCRLRASSSRYSTLPRPSTIVT